MLVEAGIPEGVIHCLTGEGKLVGNWIVDDARIASINFTGSAEAGFSIAKTAAKHLTGYQFELGGNDPFIICEDGEMCIRDRCCSSS